MKTTENEKRSWKTVRRNHSPLAKEYFTVGTLIAVYLFLQSILEILQNFCLIFDCFLMFKNTIRSREMKKKKSFYVLESGW